MHLRSTKYVVSLYSNTESLNNDTRNVPVLAKDALQRLMYVMFEIFRIARKL